MDDIDEFLAYCRKEADDEFARVKGTNEQPNIGEDFVRVVYAAIAARRENAEMRKAIEGLRILAGLLNRAINESPTEAARDPEAKETDPAAKPF